jgi:hypothetical protein
MAAIATIILASKTNVIFMLRPWSLVPGPWSLVPHPQTLDPCPCPKSLAPCPEFLNLSSLLPVLIIVATKNKFVKRPKTATWFEGNSLINVGGRHGTPSKWKFHVLTYTFGKMI